MISIQQVDMFTIFLGILWQVSFSRRSTKSTSSAGKLLGSFYY